MRFIEALLVCTLIFVSCDSPAGSGETREGTARQPEISRDTAVYANEASGDDLVRTPARMSKEKQENHRRIVRKYGEQWDFCACVKANDSINKASQGGLTEKQAELLMKRWELIENKCREFMTGPNKTPEERALHERKVERCLGSE